MVQNLPKELTSLVDWSVSELGKVIQCELGQEKFDQIEKIRKQVKSPQGQKLDGLLRLKEDLEALTRLERYQVAHSFALMLELINSCEAAYRTSRLKIEFKGRAEEKRSYGRVIHVLTAHPTESRCQDMIYYFKKIQRLLEEHLDKPEGKHTQSLHALLTLAWRIPMSKQRKPSVMDEAEYIYSLALQKDILDIFIRQREIGQPFYIRTWVGGDKDGHPGVNEKTMVGSWQMARRFLLKWLSETFDSYIKDLEPLARATGVEKRRIQKLVTRSRKVRRQLQEIKKIRSGDSRRVHLLKESFEVLNKEYKEVLNVDSPNLHSIRLLMKVFPSLVVPIELREDSGLVHEALKNPKKSYAISKMLAVLGKISAEYDPRTYVRGFVLSQTEGVKDIVAGVTLVKRNLGATRIPVVPLFESANSLSSAVAIVEDFLKSPSRRRIVQNLWSSKFEVMLGYSDSAKENGAFPSRFLIHSAISALEKVIVSHDLIPIFFHGSGGSVERGGGSVQEQTAWWPHSALSTVKVTVQGEMIYRNYTAPEILQRQLERLASAREASVQTKANGKSEFESDLKKLSDFVKESYQEILKDPHFLNLIEWATPYSFLKDLRLGSRPSKRQGPVNLKGLRAIPWVLCWTQTRVLFPSWWGVGSYWKTLSDVERNRLKKVFQASPLFSSYIKVLGFTLEKIEMDIFALYLHSSGLPKDVADSFFVRFKNEYECCQNAVREMTGEKSLLWYRPWLETSISLRSPLIHPLNVLQLLALKDKDVPLLRETVTGIASGMLTTG